VLTTYPRKQKAENLEHQRKNEKHIFLSLRNMSIYASVALAVDAAALVASSIWND
jgi:hypothetical protein